jgi:hypothetical protein
VKWPSILTDSKELFQIMAEKLIESPKPAMVSFSYSFTVGLLGTVYDWFREGIPFASMVVGFIGAALMARLTWKKSERESIETETAKMERRIAMERMRKLGIDIRKEDQA